MRDQALWKIKAVITVKMASWSPTTPPGRSIKKLLNRLFERPKLIIVRELWFSSKIPTFNISRSSQGSNYRHKGGPTFYRGGKIQMLWAGVWFPRHVSWGSFSLIIDRLARTRPSSDTPTRNTPTHTHTTTNCHHTLHTTTISHHTLITSPSTLQNPKKGFHPHKIKQRS